MHKLGGIVCERCSKLLREPIYKIVTSKKNKQLHYCSEHCYIEGRLRGLQGNKSNPMLKTLFDIK